MSEEEILKLAGASRKEALEQLRRTLLIAKMREFIYKRKGVTVSDKEVRDAYEKEFKKMAKRPATVHVLQIFIKRDPALSEKANREKAEQALKRIQAGDAFKTVARDVCQGAFQQKAGDFGPMPLDKLPSFLQEEVVKLKPGELSGVIKSQYGYHILKLIDTTPAKEISFKEIAPQIRARLLARKGNKAVQEYCDEVTRGKKIIRVYLDLDKQIAVRPELRKLFEKARTDMTGKKDSAASGSSKGK